MLPKNLSLPLALRPRETAKALSISERHLWQLTKDGHLPCVRVGSGRRKTVLLSRGRIASLAGPASGPGEGG
jgi:excisionase family DNA binding protein